MAELNHYLTTSRLTALSPEFNHPLVTPSSLPLWTYMYTTQEKHKKPLSVHQTNDQLIVVAR